MVDPSDPGDPARALPAGLAASFRAATADLAAAHRTVLPRDYRRRAIPSRSARPRDLTISAAPGGVWLDIVGRAGILFDVDQWSQLCLEALALLFDCWEDDDRVPS